MMTERPLVTPETFVSRLHEISEHGGTPYGRAYLLFEEETKHSQEVLKYKGYLALSDAFKCFFLETVELSNIEYRMKQKVRLSEFYTFFLPRITQSFQSLCAAERISVQGYPYHAYTLLRNLFDNVGLTSAVLQGLVDFHSIEGLTSTPPADLLTTRKLRKKIQFAVRREMIGDRSGLSNETLAELSRWDAMFDFETHGSLLSLTQAAGWISGTAGLHVLPKFEEVHLCYL